MWFKPIKAGTYEVICGQLCGLGHYSMKGSVVVDTPEDYQAWLKERADMAAQSQVPPPMQRPRASLRRDRHPELCRRLVHPSRRMRRHRRRANCPRQRPQRVRQLTQRRHNHRSGSAGCQPASLGSLPRLFGSINRWACNRVLPAGCRQLQASSPRSPGEEAQRPGILCARHPRLF